MWYRIIRQGLLGWEMASLPVTMDGMGSGHIQPYSGILPRLFVRVIRLDRETWARQPSH